MSRTLIVRQQRAPLRGTAQVPGDKSISHRALLFGALAHGTTHAEGWLPAEDVRATLAIVRALGVAVEQPAPTTVLVHGTGAEGLREAETVLDCGGSGTTMRLLAGLLAGFPFLSVLTGNDALRRRPMERVTVPLRRMGASILARSDNGRERAPLAIRGGGLRATDEVLPVASAQVKSALLLAALHADGASTITEAGPTRDHTERSLQAMGAQIERHGARVMIHPLDAPLRPLTAADGGAYHIPGDLSSAAFPLAAALMVPGSEIRLTHVGVNPTRCGFLEIAEGMGGALSMVAPDIEEIEPTATLFARHAPLRGMEIGGEVVVRAIDEFPILAVMAARAEGVTRVRDAAELRVKESDRIAAVARELGKMGVTLEEASDGFTARGAANLHGAVVDSHMDHRLAMSLAVAGLVATGETRITRAEVIDDSFPGFVELMRGLGTEMEWID